MAAGVVGLGDKDVLGIEVGAGGGVTEGVTEGVVVIVGIIGATGGCG